MVESDAHRARMHRGYVDAPRSERAFDRAVGGEVEVTTDAGGDSHVRTEPFRSARSHASAHGDAAEINVALERDVEAIGPDVPMSGSSPEATKRDRRAPRGHGGEERI